MTTRKFRLIIEKNKSKFSDNCSAFVDCHLSFISKPKYVMYSLDMPKWMKDMLDKIEYQIVEGKVEDIVKELYDGKDGMEINVKI